MRETLADRLMAERIVLPGADVIVTRAMAYSFLERLGYDRSARGFGSIDYMVFAPAAVNLPLSEDAEQVMEQIVEMERATR